jgi:hypothetical protein
MNGKLNLTKQPIGAGRFLLTDPVLGGLFSSLALHDTKRQILRKVRRRLAQEKLLRA